MTTLDTMRRCTAAAMVCIALLSAPVAQAAVPASWKDTGFSIDANGMTLHDVLEEFGRVYGVRLEISANQEQTVTGRLKADNGAAFLDRIAQPYKFRWFVYSDTLYVVPRDDNASVRLEVGEDAVQDAKAALTGVGLFDSRFGWGELPDEGVVIVSGPREYVNLAKEILLPDGLKKALRGQQIMVFRLKYASATDRTISARDHKESIPGVKTILTNLLLGPKSHEKISNYENIDLDSNKRSRRPRTERGTAHELAIGGPGSRKNQARNEPEERADRSSKSKNGSESGVRIEADPALNAIMIYDDVRKRQLYQSLINELDIEPQQVEIEALIVDIDRSKLAQMGAEWGVRSSGGNVTARLNSSGGDSHGVELPLPGSTMLISNAARFYARLKAMEATGEARVLATPTVLTLDNVAAVLDLSQTRY
ncbi:MAG: hrcC, partial [Burkholderia sp.]|nr:hrcC [Burkholderia sp.]